LARSARAFASRPSRVAVGRRRAAVARGGGLVAAVGLRLRRGGRGPARRLGGLVGLGDRRLALGLEPRLHLGDALEHLELEPLAPAIAELVVGGRRHDLLGIDLDRLVVVVVERRGEQPGDQLVDHRDARDEDPRALVGQLERAGVELVVDLVGVAAERVAILAEQEQLAGVEVVEVRRERGARQLVVDRLLEQVVVLEQADQGGGERGLARISGGFGRRRGGRRRRRRGGGAGRLARRGRLGRARRGGQPDDSHDPERTEAGTNVGRHGPNLA
jgi:hypothetical protein